jgi:hypothetical protein
LERESGRKEVVGEGGRREKRRKGLDERGKCGWRLRLSLSQAGAFTVQKELSRREQTKGRSNSRLPHP